MSAAPDQSAAERRPTPISEGDLPAGAFRVDAKVRFSHCDPAGIVYTPRFFDIANGAMEDFFAGALGLDYHVLIGTERIGLGYASAEGTFFRPVMMGDVLTIVPLVESVGGASAAFVFHLLRDRSEVARMRLVMVTTSLKTHRPMRYEPLRTALTAYQEQCR